jgi:hypothetical protein
MAKVTLHPETRAILESYGAIEPPPAPSAEALAEAIRARDGRLILETGERDASRRLFPTRAIVEMADTRFEASHPQDRVAIAEAFAKALRGTKGTPNGDVWQDG